MTNIIEIIEFQHWVEGQPWSVPLSTPNPDSDQGVFTAAKKASDRHAVYRPHSVYKKLPGLLEHSAFP